MPEVESIQKLELLENGLDFLIKGLNAFIEKSEKESSSNLFANVSLLTSNGTELPLLENSSCPKPEAVISNIELKYAILHISAGIELILKERLKQEHWSLIFDNIDKANQEALGSGNFKSVYMDTVIIRLKQIAGVAFDEDSTKYFDELKKERNRIEHFHFKSDQPELKEKVSNAVMAILSFIVGNLNPAGFEETSKGLYRKFISSIIMAGIDDTCRIELLRKDISERYNDRLVLQCNVCFHDFLILDENSYCLFCGNKPSTQEIFDDTIPDSTANSTDKCKFCSSMLIYHQKYQLICLECRKSLL